MVPSSNPWGRGFRHSGGGNTGLTLHWDSTAFLNWVYTSGSLTTPQVNVKNSNCLIYHTEGEKHFSSQTSFLTWICDEMEDHLCDTAWTPSRCERWPSSGRRHLSLFSPHSVLLKLPGSTKPRNKLTIQHDRTVTPSNKRKGRLTTSSWKATVRTEPSCLMRLATTSSGFPRLTMRLLSRRCKNRHTGQSYTMPGNLHPG